MTWTSQSNINASSMPTLGKNNTDSFSHSGNTLIPVVPSANLEVEKLKTQPQRRHYRASPKPGSGYVCRRCGSGEHYLENCPTNNDPNFEKAKPVIEQEALFYAKDNTSTLASGKVC